MAGHEIDEELNEEATAGEEHRRMVVSGEQGSEPGEEPPGRGVDEGDMPDPAPHPPRTSLLDRIKGWFGR